MTYARKLAEDCASAIDGAYGLEHDERREVAKMLATEFTRAMAHERERCVATFEFDPRLRMREAADDYAARIRALPPEEVAPPPTPKTETR